MKKVLVTGARGFIGSHLVDKLLDMGEYEVVATDLKTASKEFLNPDVRFIPADLSKKSEVEFLFGKEELAGVEIVFHLAAIFDFYPPDSVMHKNNVIGTENLVKSFKQSDGKKKRIILYSSGAIYGDTSSVVAADERFKPHPRNAYERSKLSQEKALKNFLCRCSNELEPVIIRPAAVVGPRSRYGVAKIFEYIAGGQIQFFLGKKNLVAAMVHVEDLVRATIHLATFPFKKLVCASGFQVPTFNVVDDSRYTYEELMKYGAELLKESHGAKILPLHLPVFLIMPLVWWQEFLVRKFGTKPKLTRGLMDFFKTPMTMSNLALKRTGFTLKYPDTKETLRLTGEWYKERRWV